MPNCEFCSTNGRFICKKCFVNYAFKRENEDSIQCVEKQHLIQYKLLILMIQELIIILFLFTIRIKIEKSVQMRNLVKIVKVPINYFMIIDYVCSSLSKHPPPP